MRIEGKIAVMGAGAIGGSIAAYLARDGYEITVIDAWADHIDAIRSDGLRLTDVKDSFKVDVEALHLSDLGASARQFDTVFLSVKSYDTTWTTVFIERFLKPTGAVYPAQNGMNDEAVAEVVGFSRTVGCVPTISSAIYDPGHVIRTDPIKGLGFHVGELNGAITPRAQAVADALNVIGPADATSNIWGARWSKLIANATGNAPSGLIGPNPENMTADQQELLGLLQVAITAETLRVGTSLGFVFEPLFGPLGGVPQQEFIDATVADQYQQVKAKVDAVPANGALGLTDEQKERLGVPGRASLLQDVIKGRRTEANYLNGYIVEKGQLAGVATPVNAGVTDVMNRVERGELQPGPDNVDLLREFLPG